MKRRNWPSLILGFLSGITGWAIGALTYYLWVRGWGKIVFGYLARLFLTVAVGWLVAWVIVSW